MKIPEANQTKLGLVRLASLPSGQDVEEDRGIECRTGDCMLVAGRHSRHFGAAAELVDDGVHVGLEHVVGEHAAGVAVGTSKYPS